jgi:hypothetical protein
VRARQKWQPAYELLVKICSGQGLAAGRERIWFAVITDATVASVLREDSENPPKNTNNHIDKMGLVICKGKNK